MASSFSLKRASINDSILYAAPAVQILGIGQRNTVSNGPDDGTLDKCAAVWWNSLRHGTTGQMVANLVSHTNERIANVDGHGNTGLMETGMGQNGPFNENTILTSWNQFAWGPVLAGVANQNYFLMVLWGCHTGEGADGADLLFEMAQVAGFPVQATNGFVYTNGQSIWIEPGSVWVTATPTVRPTPVPAPSPHNFLISDEPETIYLVLDGKLVGVSLNDVTKVTVAKSSFTKRQAPYTVSGSLATALAHNIFFTRPTKIPGSPSAFVTAKVSLTFAPGAKAARLNLIIYNDRLALDPNSGYAYYMRSGVFGIF